VIRSRSKEPSLRVLKAQGCKFSGADGGIKATKDSMTILKGERTTSLYKIIESVIVGDASVVREKEGID